MRNDQKKHKINNEIVAIVVRLVGNENKVCSLKEALVEAKNQNLDLVQMSQNNDNVVCKIMDYKKFIFDSEKNIKVKKELEMKEIRFSAVIASNDINHKIIKGRELLELGHKLKLTVKFSGRNIKFIESGYKILDMFTDKLKDISKVSSPATLNNKYLSLILEKKI
jgi:translation initiation factor IF-3